MQRANRMESLSSADDLAVRRHLNVCRLYSLLTKRNLFEILIGIVQCTLCVEAMSGATQRWDIGTSPLLCYVKFAVHLNGNLSCAKHIFMNQ